MDKNNQVFPFPQADDIEKVKKIINIEKTEKLFDVAYMSAILGDITSRQVQYYISACQYLGIINRNKIFTEFGNNLRKCSSNFQNIELIKAILSDSVFGTVYVTEKVMGVSLEREDVIEIMKLHVTFNSEEMYHRRSQTVIKWIEWIKKEFKEI